LRRSCQDDRITIFEQGPPECQDQMLIATFDYAVSTAEVRMKCRPELELSGGKYLEIVRPTVMLIAELEELR